MQTIQTPPGTIRSFDLARDGDVVADLIEEAFALKNDPDGQVLLIQMRENARRLKQTAWMPLAGSTLGFVGRSRDAWWATSRSFPTCTMVAACT